MQVGKLLKLSMCFWSFRVINISLHSGFILRPLELVLVLGPTRVVLLFCGFLMFSSSPVTILLFIPVSDAEGYVFLGQ